MVYGIRRRDVCVLLKRHAGFVVLKYAAWEGASEVADRGEWIRIALVGEGDLPLLVNSRGCCRGVVGTELD